MKPLTYDARQVVLMARFAHALSPMFAQSMDYDREFLGTWLEAAVERGAPFTLGPDVWDFFNLQPEGEIFTWNPAQ